MDTTCEECGTTFETLSARRLHDCPAAGPAGDGEAGPAGDGEAGPAGDGEAGPAGDGEAGPAGDGEGEADGDGEGEADGDGEDEADGDGEGEADGDREAEADGEQDVDLAEAVERIRELEEAAGRQAERRSSTELTAALSQAQTGEPAAVHRLLAYYERHLADEWGREDDDCYWGFHQRYYEPVTAAIDDVVRAAGWAFLADLLEAYWPAVAIDSQQSVVVPAAGDRRAYWGDYPHVSHVLTNVTGRSVIRRRLEDGVAAVPSTALEYLCRFHRNPDDEGAWIDSVSYGWGIDHPDHPFAETISALLRSGYEIWVGGTVEHALHADQRAATALLERVVQRDLVDEPMLLFSSLGDVEHGAYPYEPQYWDWETAYPDLATDGFSWDPEVKARLRSLVETTDVAGDLPAEWTFADLEL